MKPVIINISIYRDNKYYHLLRFSISKDDSYVHFVSSFRNEVKTSDSINVFYKKVPDHISYHKDGKVHIKHKDGTYHDLPFKLLESFLIQDKLIDHPWMAISFYDAAFDEHTNYFKSSTNRPEGHIIIETHKVSFTILVKIRDMTKIPLENRSVDFEIHAGGIYPDSPYPNLLDNNTNIEKMFPVLNVCLNPTYNLFNELVLFSEEEQKNEPNFIRSLENTFSRSR